MTVPWWLTHLEHQLKQLVQAEPTLQALVTALEDHTLHLHLTDLNQDFYWVSHDQDWHLRPSIPAGHAVDATLTASSVALFAAGLAPHAGRVAGVRVEGDLQLALTLQQLLSQVTIDHQARLGEWVGETPAAAITHAVGLLAKVIQAIGTEARQAVQARQSWVVGQEELAEFCDEVDQLVARVDRLEQQQKGRLA